MGIMGFMGIIGIVGQGLFVLSPTTLCKCLHTHIKSSTGLVCRLILDKK